jgi:hypothetical protein
VGLAQGVSNGPRYFRQRRRKIDVQENRFRRPAGWADGIER